MNTNADSMSVTLQAPCDGNPDMVPQTSERSDAGSGRRGPRPLLRSISAFRST
jgi:hypothetical protein